MNTKIVILIAAVLFIVMVVKIYAAVNAPDTQCTTTHTVSYNKPKNQKTSEDFFALGNYNYDTGKCKEAVTDYTKAIELNPNFAKAYNNRAYTQMRLQNYREAILDLNNALSIKPNYIEALMNRGDIYNYYYAVDKNRAIADYNKVIKIGKEKDLSNSVCGHKAMAETNHMIPLVILKFIFNKGNCN